MLWLQAVVYTPGWGASILNEGVQLGRLTAGNSQQITIPLADLGVTGDSLINGFWFRNAGSGPQATFYLDDVTLSQVPEPTTATLTGLGLLGALAIRRKG
jgi:hypothetical protein